MTRPFRIGRRLTRAVFVSGLLILAGCRTSLPVHPDDIHGHRFDQVAGGRETIQIHPPHPEEEYFLYPAIIDSVHARQALFDPNLPLEGQTVPVDVVVKGSFPDACMELHKLSQNRYVSLIHVELTARRPRRARCERAVRPYRFYFELEGQYGVGHYSLTINGEGYPFQVRALTLRE